MRKYASIAVYSFFFLLFLFRLFYDREEWVDRADEEAHLSYLAYVQENPWKWIPEFEHMDLYEDGQEQEDGVWRYTAGEKTCYLRQPPLYYQLLQLTGGVVVQESTEGSFLYSNLVRLKTANLYLTATAMALFLYLGCTRLGSAAFVWHVVYAAAVTCAASVRYGTGMDGDNLLCLGTALLALGFLRCQERRKDYVTYGLMAGGFFLSGLSRISATALVLFFLLAAGVVEIGKKKKAEFICNKYFLATVPLYLAVIVYVLMFLLRNYMMLSGVSGAEETGHTGQVYLPVLCCLGVIGAKRLTEKYSYRVWHFLGYKAKARRLKKESLKKTDRKKYTPMLPCVFAVLMIAGGVAFETLASAPESVYDRLQQVNQEQAMKKLGYQVVYAQSGMKQTALEETGYLMDGFSLIQDFTVTEEMLDYEKLAIGIPVGTYGRKTTVSLYVEVYQDSGFGKAYKVDCSRLKNKEEVPIAFETAGMTEGICHVKVYSDAQNGNDAVTVYLSGECVLADDMQTAGIRREKNLAMTIFTPYDTQRAE